jgi:hypothetical protein
MLCVCCAPPSGLIPFGGMQPDPLWKVLDEVPFFRTELNVYIINIYIKFGPKKKGRLDAGKYIRVLFNKYQPARFFFKYFKINYICFIYPEGGAIKQK